MRVTSRIHMRIIDFLSSPAIGLQCPVRLSPRQGVIHNHQFAFAGVGGAIPSWSIVISVAILLEIVMVARVIIF